MSLDLNNEVEPLPRGRHKLSSEAVLASQRARLLAAILELVGRDGYEATTVPQTVATARVSRNAFYELFDDKADCFLAACDAIGEELLNELLALATEPSWLLALREGTLRYLNWWQQRPIFATAYFVSLPVVGERARNQRERQYAAFRAMFAALGARARAEQHELEALDDFDVRVLVTAVTELVAEEVRAGHASNLTDLADQVTLLAVRLLADDATAKRTKLSWADDTS